MRRWREPSNASSLLSGWARWGWQPEKALRHGHTLAGSWKSGWFARWDMEEEFGKDPGRLCESCVLSLPPHLHPSMSLESQVHSDLVAWQG